MTRSNIYALCVRILKASYEPTADEIEIICKGFQELDATLREIQLAVMDAVEKSRIE